MTNKGQATATAVTEMMECLIFGLACAGFEVFEGFFQALAQVDLWLPAQEGLGFGDVGTATGGVVLGERLQDDLRLGAGYGQNLFRAFEDRPLVGVADVDREMLLGTREADDAVDEVGDIAKAAGL